MKPSTGISRKNIRPRRLGGYSGKKNQGNISIRFQPYETINMEIRERTSSHKAKNLIILSY